MKLADTSVVITGAGSGVGRASTLLFCAQGAKVVVADVHDEWAAETVRLVTAAGGIAFGVHCDVRSEADVEAAVSTAVTQFGRLDVMFNNAGITGMKPGQMFEDHTVDDWQRLTDINFKGVFLGCKHAVKQFIMANPDKPFEAPSDEYVEFAASLQPNGRIVTAEDCAAAALFLACNDSINITGVLLPVDGGYTAR